MPHLSQEELSESLSTAQDMVTIGSKYYHYKKPDQLYIVIAIGVQEETEEVCVVYQSEYGNGITWVRDYSDWNKQLMHNGKLVSKFNLVHE